MTTLVIGASGATGRLLVEHLLKRGEDVRVIVRSSHGLPTSWTNHSHLTVVIASILDLSDAELAQHVSGCRAVASCLGHTLSLKGIFGSPRRLVTEATRRVCRAIQTTRTDCPTKFVLMNTAGNSNRDLAEPLSLGHRAAVGLIRRLLPPHADNEAAADYLRSTTRQHQQAMEWVAVRPDSLKDAREVTAYQVCPSPTRSALFHPGATSRINVAHFMAELITDEAAWLRWRGRMPVIYNRV